MTDFEKTKAELHKLVDGLDENKIWFDDKDFIKPSNLNPLAKMKYLLQQSQKEPTLEDKLQELGFHNLDKYGFDTAGPMMIHKLYYINSNVNEIFEIGYYYDDVKNKHSFFTIDFSDEKILKCAKFLKEMRDG